MAQVVELFNSRTQQSATDKGVVEFRYVVFNAADEAAVNSAVQAQAPTTYTNPLYNAALYRKSIDITEQLNATTWKVTVRFETPTQLDTLQTQTSFDTTGGTQHITQSFATTKYGTGAPDLNGAIGDDGESVQGVDVTVPVFQFQETHYISDNAFNAWAIYALTGCINSSTFRGWAAGEVLFLGAAGTWRTDRNVWEITYKFAASPNLSNLSVGTIAGIDKGGWDYLWIRYATTPDVSAPMLVKKPVGVYVEQVYAAVPFSQLGIGS